MVDLFCLTGCAVTCFFLLLLAVLFEWVVTFLCGVSFFHPCPPTPHFPLKITKPITACVCSVHLPAVSYINTTRQRPTLVVSQPPFLRTIGRCECLMNEPKASQLKCELICVWLHLNIRGLWGLTVHLHTSTCIQLKSVSTKVSTVTQTNVWMSLFLSLILSERAFVTWARGVKENKRTHCATQSPECWQCSRMKLSCVCVCVRGSSEGARAVAVCHVRAGKSPFKQGHVSVLGAGLTYSL